MASGLLITQGVFEGEEGRKQCEWECCMRMAKGGSRVWALGPKGLV